MQGFARPNIRNPRGRAGQRPEALVASLLPVLLNLLFSAETRDSLSSGHSWSSGFRIDIKQNFRKPREQGQGHFLSPCC